MLKLKETALVIFAVGSSLVCIDGMSSSGIPDQVIMPVAQNTWSVGASALYLKPSFGGNGLGYNSFSNYGTDFSGNNVEVDGATNHLSHLQPKQSWGFLLEGAYGFGSGNDMDINWYHLDNSTHRHFPQGTLFAGSASALYAGRFKIAPEWDAVHLEVGQQFNFDDANVLRLHAGAAWARVENTFTNYPQLTATGPALFVTKDRLIYSGFGPRVGADFTTHVAHGFGFYAKAAGSLLVGTAKQSVNGYHDLTGFNLYSTGNYHQSNNSVVVPELQGRLGVKYDFQCKRGTLRVDLGYLWTTYLNALVSQVGSGVVSSSISNSSSANFNVNGPSLGLTWTGIE